MLQKHPYEKGFAHILNFPHNFQTGQDLGQGGNKKLSWKPASGYWPLWIWVSEPQQSKEKIHTTRGKQKTGHLRGIPLTSKYMKNDESQVSHRPKGRDKYELRENWKESCVRLELDIPVWTHEFP